MDWYNPKLLRNLFIRAFVLLAPFLTFLGDFPLFALFLSADVMETSSWKSSPSPGCRGLPLHGIGSVPLTRLPKEASQMVLAVGGPLPVLLYWQPYCSFLCPLSDSTQRCPRLKPTQHLDELFSRADQRITDHVGGTTRHCLWRRGECLEI